MKVFQVVVFAVLLVLNTALKGRACDQFCSPVDDLSVRNNLSNSRVNVRLTVNATKADLLNKAGRFRWFYDTVPLYEENCSSDSSDVCRCNLTRQPTTYGTPLCSWNYTCDYNRNRIPQYLWQADCSNSSPPTELTRVSGATADCQECTVYECEPINYKIPVLMLESNPRNCNPFSLQEAVWSWEIKEIPVACSCNRKCRSWYCPCSAGQKGRLYLALPNKIYCSIFPGLLLWYYMPALQLCKMCGNNKMAV